MSAATSLREPRAVHLALRLIALYLLTPALGLVLLVGAFMVGVLAQIDIMFYRGLVLSAMVFAALLVFAGLFVRWRADGLAFRDVFAAAILSLSLNVSFLVLVPVTADRSISIFMLAQMAAHPEREFTTGELRTMFIDAYVGERDQIGRRIHEQAVSGNVTATPAGARITDRGRFVIAVAQWIGRVFGSKGDSLRPVPISAPRR